MNTKVLVLDDDRDLCETYVSFLNEKKMTARPCLSIEDFHNNMQSFTPQFLLIDKYISHQDSYGLIEYVRSHSAYKSLPIIVVTGCDDFQQKIKALEMGADDVLIKPVRLDELYTKIQAVLRRSYVYQTADQEITYKNLVLSPMKREVFIGDAKIPLTTTEFKLLHELLVEKGHPVHRESLAYKGLTSRNNNYRTIDVHINSLRSKLGDIGSKIKTLRGRGYMLVD